MQNLQIVKTDHDPVVEDDDDEESIIVEESFNPLEL